MINYPYENNSLSRIIYLSRSFICYDNPLEKIHRRSKFEELYSFYKESNPKSKKVSEETDLFAIYDSVMRRGLNILNLFMKNYLFIIVVFQKLFL